MLDTWLDAEIVTVLCRRVFVTQGLRWPDAWAGGQRSKPLARAASWCQLATPRVHRRHTDCSAYAAPEKTRHRNPVLRSDLT